MALLQKSPEVSKLLVRLHERHERYSNGKGDEAKIRAELAGIMADLLGCKIGVVETEMLTDVLMGLMRQAEVELKRAVAERVASMHDVPLRMITHLANESIDVAEPILKRSSVLDDNDLIYIVKGQGADHWRAIASRPRMNDNLINALAGTNDVQTAIYLSENKSITLTQKAVEAFCVLAQENEALAKPLLAREELPQKLAMKLYEYVGQELKSFIDENFDTPKNTTLSRTVDDVVYGLLADEHKAKLKREFIPPAEMLVQAEALLERGALNATLMVDQLRQGLMSNFVAQFSVYCGLKCTVALKVLEQTSAQGLAIACKATGISKSEFVNIFILTSRLRSGHVMTQGELSRALSYYDRVKQNVARKILAQSRK